MLEIRTGCRLHFGLMELASGQPHRFGGLGLMVQQPRVCVRVGPKRSVDVQGSAGKEIDARVRMTVQHAQKSLGHSLRDDWTVVAAEHPQLHSGLGLGTQLAAAVAAATQLATMTMLNQQVGLGAHSEWQTFASAQQSIDLSPDLRQSVIDTDPSSQADRVRALACLCGRGKRSAVGLHGFLYGGLVQDLGQSGNELEPPQVAGHSLSSPGSQGRSFGTRSCTFPSEWPVVLILSGEGGDMCGAMEEHLIDEAGSVPNSQRATMLELSNVCMSAAAAGDFLRFVEALEKYMDIAATLFAPVQAGRYRDHRIAARVAMAQRAGLRGVGQSSWGPTVFAMAENEELAERAAEELRSQLATDSAEVIITRAANQGATWREIATGVQHAS